MFGLSTRIAIKPNQSMFTIQISGLSVSVSGQGSTPVRSEGLKAQDSKKATVTTATQPPELLPATQALCHPDRRGQLVFPRQTPRHRTLWFQASLRSFEEDVLLLSTPQEEAYLVEVNVGCPSLEVNAKSSSSEQRRIKRSQVSLVAFVRHSLH